MRIEQGDGRFSLFFYMWEKGNPHVAMYGGNGGGSFANVYFGTGDSLLVRGWSGDKDDAKAVPAAGNRRLVAAQGNGQPGERQSIEKLQRSSTPKERSSKSSLPKSAG